MKDFWENFSIVLGIAVVLAFILIGGWMIGAATSDSNKAEHKQQLECIDRGGHVEYVPNIGSVCKK